MRKGSKSPALNAVVIVPYPMAKGNKKDSPQESGVEESCVECSGAIPNGGGKKDNPQ